MKGHFLSLGAACSLLLATALPAQERIVAVGSSITEIVYALGQESLLVGSDDSSLFPEAAAKLPRVGYARTLSAEGVLSLKPTLILASEEAGPPAAVEQLKSSGVRWVTIPTADHSLAGAQKKVTAVAKELKSEAAGQTLAAKMAAEAKLPAASGAPRKVLFLYARGAGTLNVSGTGTAAHGMIEAAGARNAVTGYTGYKPLTAEAAVVAAPDVIVIPSRGLESMGGLDGLLKQPGLAQTPAGAARRVVVMDDLLLLSFGPRTGQAVAQLAQAISK